MSKSLTRVTRHLETLGLALDILHLEVPTTTAQQAADAVGCAVDQIVKSVIFLGMTSARPILFLTSGANRVDTALASELAAEPLGKADAALIRAETGFAIGGVSPFGHLNPIRAYLDLRLMDFDMIWAAAGTPHHMFEIAPDLLVTHTGAQIAKFTE